MLRKAFISFSEVFVDGILGGFQGEKVAIVKDCFGHTAEY